MTKEKKLNELVNQAQGLINSKEFDKAIPIYEAILNEDSSHPKALAHLAIIYLMKERYIDAVNLLEKSLKVTIPIIGDYHNLATAYNALKDYKSAIKAYEDIVKINPNAPDIYKLLGDAQMKVVDYYGAIDSYKKALEMDPDEFQSIYDYGMILAQCLHHEEALKYLREAIKLHPDHLECMYLMGECLSSIYDYEAAKIIYQKMMTLMPEAEGPHICYATCLMFEGKYEEPAEILKNTIIKKPNSHAARNNLGMLYLVNKKFHEAWKYIDSRILLKNEIDITKRYDMLKTLIDLDVNKKKLTEIEAKNKLHKFRKLNKNYLFPSFDTIAGAGANGAIVHYRVSKKSNKVINKNDLFLCDSGGQYKFGTTDVTRTICFSKPKKSIKNLFTKVLKGHIAVALTNLKTQNTGKKIDRRARKFLKKDGLDYAHGTGHGVGFFLNVHEGPQSISKYNSIKIEKGMILSNEPGFYKKNHFGIRIENLLYVKQQSNSLYFENLTMAPIEKDLINYELLDKIEKNYLFKYHLNIYKEYSSLLNKKERMWLASLI